jgi:hypothetical protein
MRVAHFQAQVFIALDAIDGKITDFLMDVETSIRRNFQFNVELRVATRGTELHGCLISANIEIDVRFSHMALTPRLGGVPQPDIA